MCVCMCVYRSLYNGLNVYYVPDSYVETLTLHVMVLGGTRN